MISRLTLATLLGLGLTLGACGDKDADDTAGGGTGGDTDADTDAGTDSETDSDTDDDTDHGAIATVRGTVQYADGSPAPGLQVRLCYYSCKTYDSDASGGFEYAFRSRARRAGRWGPGSACTWAGPG